MADQDSTMFYADGRSRESAKFYTLQDWAWDLERKERAEWVKRRRPFVGLNPTLERVTNG